VNALSYQGNNKPISNQSLSTLNQIQMAGWTSSRLTPGKNYGGIDGGDLNVINSDGWMRQKPQVIQPKDLSKSKKFALSLLFPAPEQNVQNLKKENQGYQGCKDCLKRLYKNRNSKARLDLERQCETLETDKQNAIALVTSVKDSRINLPIESHLILSEQERDQRISTANKFHSTEVESLENECKNKVQEKVVQYYLDAQRSCDACMHKIAAEKARRKKQDKNKKKGGRKDNGVEVIDTYY
jgi:hypothetical protein